MFPHVWFTNPLSTSLHLITISVLACLAWSSSPWFCLVTSSVLCPPLWVRLSKSVTECFANLLPLLIQLPMFYRLAQLLLNLSFLLNLNHTELSLISFNVGFVNPKDSKLLSIALPPTSFFLFLSSTSSAVTSSFPVLLSVFSSFSSSSRFTSVLSSSSITF